MNMGLSTLPTGHLTPTGIEQDQKGKVTPHLFRFQPQNTVQNIELPRHPLFPFLSVPMDTPVVHIGFVCDCLVFRLSTHSVVHEVGFKQTLPLIDEEQVLQQVTSLRVLEKTLALLRNDKSVVVNDPLVFPQLEGGVLHTCAKYSNLYHPNLPLTCIKSSTSPQK